MQSSYGRVNNAADTAVPGCQAFDGSEGFWCNTLCDEYDTVWTDLWDASQGKRRFKGDRDFATFSADDDLGLYAEQSRDVFGSASAGSLNLVLEGGIGGSHDWR